MDTRIQKSSLCSPLSHGMRRIQNMRIQNCFWILVSKMMRGVSIFTCVLQQLLKINVSKRIKKTKNVSKSTFQRIQNQPCAYQKNVSKKTKTYPKATHIVSKRIQKYRIQKYQKLVRIQKNTYPNVSKNCVPSAPSPLKLFTKIQANLLKSWGVPLAKCIEIYRNPSKS